MKLCVHFAAVACTSGLSDGRLLACQVSLLWCCADGTWLGRLIGGFWGAEWVWPHEHVMMRRNQSGVDPMPACSIDRNRNGTNNWRRVNRKETIKSESFCWFYHRLPTCTMKIFGFPARVGHSLNGSMHSSSEMQPSLPYMSSSFEWVKMARTKQSESLWSSLHAGIVKCAYLTHRGRVTHICVSEQIYHWFK